MNFKVETSQEEIEKLVCKSNDLKKQLKDMMRSIVICCLNKETEKPKSEKETAA
jgi:hypothetical protein